MMMNPDIKAQWLAALRSGEYEQARGFLHPSQKTYCCLGVLCNLHARTTGAKWEDDYPWRAYQGETHHLPTAVRKWAGLEDSDPEIEESTLSGYNDGYMGIDRPHTFTEIADLIERHL